MKTIILIFLMLLRFSICFAEDSASPLEQIIAIENEKQNFSKMITEDESHKEKKALANDIEKKQRNLRNSTFIANSKSSGLSLSVSEKNGASVTFYFEGNLIYDEQIPLTNIQQKMTRSAELTYKVKSHPVLPSAYLLTLEGISFLSGKGTPLLKKDFKQESVLYQYPVITIFDPKILASSGDEEEYAMKNQEDESESEEESEPGLLQGFFINLPISIFAKNGNFYGQGIGISFDLCLPLNLLVGETIGICFEESDDFNEFIDFLGLLVGDPLDEDSGNAKKHGESYSYFLTRLGFYVPASPNISFKIFSKAGFFDREPILGGGMNFLLHMPLENHTTGGIMLGYSYLVKTDSSSMHKYDIGLFLTSQY